MSLSFRGIGDDGGTGRKRVKAGRTASAATLSLARQTRRGLDLEPLYQSCRRVQF